MNGSSDSFLVGLVGSDVRKGAGGLLLIGVVLLLLCGTVGCQSTAEEAAVSESVAPAPEDGDEAGSASQDAQGVEETAADSLAGEAAPDPPPAPLAPDEGWQAGPHAVTYVLDAAGENDTCARCHSPAEWLPGPEDIPESCLTCKFDVDQPDPVISEESWGHVSCKTCHKVKKDEVDPEFVWLDVAVIEEYIDVDSTTDLCRKCHLEEDVLNHRPAVHVSDEHQELTCTDCHDAHQTKATCANSECHLDILEASAQIAGHDEAHQLVSCMACHDAAGLEVGPLEESGLWVTFSTLETEDGQRKTPHSSHQTQIEVSCDRCHFAGNPWDLSEAVEAGS